MNSSTSNSESRWSPSSTTPKAAFLAIALVACSEVGFLAVTDPLTGAPVLEPTADDATVSIKNEMLHTENAVRIVSIGDSSCLMGVIPEIVERETGLKTTNLGTLASLTVGGYVAMGHQALERTHKPTVIVLAALPRTFEVTLAEAQSYNQLGRFSFAYGLDVDAYDVTYAEIGSWFVKKHRLNRFPRQFGGSFEVFRQRLLDRGGFVPESRTYRAKNKNRTQFQPSPWAIGHLKRLIQSADSHGVQVVLWFSPRPTDYCTPDFLRQARDSLVPLESEFGNFAILQDQIPHWSPTRFGSESHLSEEQAAVNSRNLGRAIRKHLGERRVEE